VTLSIHITERHGDRTTERIIKLDSPETKIALSNWPAASESNPQSPVILNPADLPRRFLDADGNETSDPEKHVITHFTTAGLMFDARKPREVGSLIDARKAAAECDLLGRKGEWVIGEEYEMQLIIDRRFHEPAVHQPSFPRMPSQGLIYTSRKTAWSSTRVWFVLLNDGDVGWNFDSGGLAVPVLRVPASQ
jgi:hypothetical protein